MHIICDERKKKRKKMDKNEIDLKKQNMSTLSTVFYANLICSF